MSDDILPLRVQYLEKTVNKLIANQMSQDKKNTKGKDTAAAGDNTPVAAVAIDSSAIRMVQPAYRVPVEGVLVKVTAEVLAADPVLHEYMTKHYPECFVTE